MARLKHRANGSVIHVKDSHALAQAGAWEHLDDEPKSAPEKKPATKRTPRTPKQ